jgi:arylsulfatase A-like enzyme
VNLIVYISDALRSDHLGCYGARFVRTPTIDEFAESGVRFARAFAPGPWTCPSTASMITGLDPHRHGYLHWDSVLDPGLPTLFSVTAAYGYDTASFVFDETYLFKGLADANVAGTTASLDGVVDWLRAHRERPFCLWVHSWATHMAIEDDDGRPLEGLEAKNRIIAAIQSDSASALEQVHDAYRRSVEHQSEVLFASLLETLDDLGLREQTAVVFASDHGESWGERFADKTDVKGAYHMHGALLYDEHVDVPLIISAPGALDPATVSAQVSLVDLAPTLLELADAPIDGLDGRSLLPLADGREQADRRAVMVATDKGVISRFALRRPPWKLIHTVATGEDEAYRIDVDPREQENLSDVVPAALRDELQSELAAVPRESLSAEEEALVEARLAALGYL